MSAKHEPDASQGGCGGFWLGGVSRELRKAYEAYSEERDLSTIERAAMLVEFAKMGKETLGYRLTSRTRLCYRLRVKYHLLYRLAAWGVLVVHVFEYPVWTFRVSSGDWSNGSIYPAFGINYLPLFASSLLLLMCLSILWAAVALEMGFKWQSVDYPFTAALILILTVQSMSVLMSFIYAAIGSGPLFSTNPLSAFLPLLIEHRFDEDIVHFCRTLPKFFVLLVILTTVVLLYTVLGFEIFDPTSAEAETYFPNFGTALWNMLMVLCGSDWPTPMMPALESSRWYSLYFFVFIILGDWGLLNLILGFVYLTFRIEQKSITTQEKNWQTLHLRRAFAYLAESSDRKLPMSSPSGANGNASDSELEESHQQYMSQSYQAPPSSLSTSSPAPAAIELTAKALTHKTVESLLHEIYQSFVDTLHPPSHEECHELVLLLDAEHRGEIVEEDFLQILERCSYEALKTLQSKKVKFNRFFITSQALHLREQQLSLKSPSFSMSQSLNVLNVVAVMAPSQTTTLRDSLLSRDEQLIRRNTNTNASIVLDNDISELRASMGNTHAEDSARLHRSISLASAYGGIDHPQIMGQFHLRQLRSLTMDNGENKSAPTLQMLLKAAEMRIDSVSFDVAMDVLLFTLALVSFLSAAPAAALWTFLALSLTELILKVQVKGWFRYMRSFRCTIDGSITIILFCVAMGNLALHQSVENAFGVRLMLLARVLMLPRNILETKRFHRIRERNRVAFGHAFRSGKHLMFLSLLMFCTMFAYSALGLQLFGGSIVTTGDTGKRIDASLFGESGYWPLTFNDLPSSFVTLFTLLHVNNTHVTTSGYVAAVGTTAEIFFAIWYVVGVLLLLNVLTAMLVNQFAGYLEILAAQRRADALKAQAEDEAKQQEHALGDLTRPSDSTVENESVKEGLPAEVNPPPAAAVDSVLQTPIRSAVIPIQSSQQTPQEPTGVDDSRAQSVPSSAMSENVATSLQSNASRSAFSSGHRRQSYASGGIAQSPAVFEESVFASASKRRDLAKKVEQQRRQSIQMNRDVVAKDEDETNQSRSTPRRSSYLSSSHSGRLPFASAISQHSTQFPSLARSSAIEAEQKPLSQPVLVTSPSTKRKTKLSMKPPHEYLDGITHDDDQLVISLSVHSTSQSQQSQLSNSVADNSHPSEGTSTNEDDKHFRVKSALTAAIRGSDMTSRVPATPSVVTNPLLQSDNIEDILLAKGIAESVQTKGTVKSSTLDSRGKSTSDGHTANSSAIAQPFRRILDSFFSDRHFSVHAKAAILVQFARDGEEHTIHCTDFSIRCYRVRSQFATVFKITSALLVLLKFFERPLWTFNGQFNQENWHNHTLFPSANMMVLSLTTTAVVKLLLYLVLFAGLATEIGYKESFTSEMFSTFTPSRGIRFGLMALLVSHLLCLVAALGSHFATTELEQLVPITSFGAIMFYMWFNRKSLQKSRVVLYIVPRLSLLLMALTFLTIIFAFFGPLVFPLSPIHDADSATSTAAVDTVVERFAHWLSSWSTTTTATTTTSSSSSSSSSTGYDDDYFSDFPTSMWSVFVAITSSDFPNQIVHVYQRNRIVALFFIAFVSLGSFGLLNLIIIIVLVEFQKGQQLALDTQRASREILLIKAFELLDVRQQGFLEKSAVRLLVRELYRHYSDFLRVGMKRKHIQSLLLDILDVDGDGVVSLDDFLFILDVLRIKIAVDDKRAYIERRFPSCRDVTVLRQLKVLVHSRVLDVSVDFLSAFLIVVNIAVHAKNLYEPTRASIALLLAIFALYLFEMICKLTVLGPQRYYSSFRNVVDGSITIVLIACFLGQLVVTRSQASHTTGFLYALRIVLMIRLLLLPRNLRLLFESQSEISKFSRLVRRIFIKIFTLTVVFFSCGYAFASMGMLLFGGVIRTDSTNAAFLDSPYVVNGFWTLNFNDFGSACITLFACLHVSDFDVIATGFTTTTTVWARVFFAFWYAFGVLLMLNVIKSFFLGEFLAIFVSPSKMRSDDIAEGPTADQSRNSELERPLTRQQWTDKQLRSRFAQRLSDAAEKRSDKDSHSAGIATSPALAKSSASSWWPRPSELWKRDTFVFSPHTKMPSRNSADVEIDSLEPNAKKLQRRTSRVRVRTDTHHEDDEHNSILSALHDDLQSDDEDDHAFDVTHEKPRASSSNVHPRGGGGGNDVDDDGQDDNLSDSDEADVGSDSDSEALDSASPDLHSPHASLLASTSNLKFVDDKGREQLRQRMLQLSLGVSSKQH